MTDLNALQRANDARCKAARLTARLNFDPTAHKAFANKARYLDVVRRCRARGASMPDEAWVFVAVIHNRESAMDFSTHLGQGDPLSRPTTHVPAGRGPFFGVDAFERGAVDALMDCAPRAATANSDWSISGMLTYLERYNGLAYANAHPPRPSPYVWSGTTVYDPPSGPGGKVLVDHGPIENVTDKQLGVAGAFAQARCARRHHQLRRTPGRAGSAGAT
jgi:lysozyme family protein